MCTTVSRCSIVSAAVFTLFGASGLSEQLPMRFYTTADGLARDDVHCVVQVKDGPIWFGTSEGASRFDGSSFRTFRVSDGLPGRDVHRILLTRDGGVWAATSGGLARLRRATDPKANLFTQVPISGLPAGAGVDRVLQDAHGTIWVGSYAGLYRLQPTRTGAFNSQRIDLRLESGASLFGQIFPGTPDPHQPVFALLEDHQGNIWIGTSAGLYCSRPDGHITLFSAKNGLPGSAVLALLEDADHKLWVGTTRGLAKVNPDLGRNRIEVESTFTDRDGLADNLVKALLRTSDGSLWVGTRSGLARFDAGAGAGQKRFRSFGVSNGLVYGNIEFLSEDSRGNVWVATDGGGAARIAPGGFSTFNQSDGFSPGYVGATALDQKGRPLILTSANGNLVVHRFDGHRFTSIELAAPEGFHPRAWIPWHQIVLESKSGYWWSTSHGGLVRYSAPGESPPRVLEPDRIFRIEDGLPDNEVGNIFEDSRGNLWIGTLAGGFAYPKFGAKAGLSMLPSGGRVMRHFSEADGLPPLDSIKIVSVFEDRSGQIWIGMHRTGVARYRNGRFQVFTTGDGVPNGGIRQFHQDGAGHLWLASTSGGLGRVQDPGADRLTITNFTTSDGLSSDEIQTITSDQFGRIYAGTGLGVDRLDPARGQVLHLTAADGLAPGEVQDSIRDSSGNLWFGTQTGISRLSPHLDLPQRPVNVLIASVRVAGQSHPLASSGVQDAGLPYVALPDLQPEESNVEIDFVGPPGVTGLRYQHRLEGADREWSPSSQLGTVSYSHLRDGAYRFLVRSVTAEGIVGSPASVSFAVLPPVWQRWWFLLSAALLTAAGVRIVYRNRVAHLLEIERMRTRIACDLHDDVGSSLSKIAILSEVAKRAGHGGAASPALERIAETSREVLESVGDLVWAINTRTGRLEDLIRRMRVFATQVFEAKDVEFQFEAIDVPLQKTITPEVLRQVYLIFKEAVNNAARHSHCTRSAVSLKGGHSSLTLIVSDNGTGFTPSQGHDQHGIESLRARASALKGEISWTFDGGTQVTLSLPLPK